MKKTKLVYEEMFPFRKDGNMVQPDSEFCKECRGRCCNAGLNIFPRDFEEGKEVASIIKLLKMELVKLYIEEAVDDDYDEAGDEDYSNDFIEVRITDNDRGSCIFRFPWGCILTADMRPVICKFYGPVVKQTGEGVLVCMDIQCYSTYGNKDWRPFKGEFLEMGVLECPNVIMNGDTK